MGRETATPVEVPWTGDAWLGPVLTCLSCNKVPEDLEQWAEDDSKQFDLTLICKTCFDDCDPEEPERNTTDPPLTLARIPTRSIRADSKSTSTSQAQKKNHT